MIFEEISRDYKIVYFNENVGQILVKYDVLDYLVPIDLHLDENGELMHGEILDSWIRDLCPVGDVVRKKMFEEGLIKNIDHIKTLVVEDESIKHLLPNFIPEPIEVELQLDTPPSVEEIERIMSIVTGEK